MPFFNLDEGKLYYEDCGKGDTLLFLHCWTGSHRFFRKQIRFFSSSYRCLAPDFPGHGLSTNISGYNPKKFASQITKFLNKLTKPKEKIVVLGHSLGGMVATQLVLENPEKFKGLVLIDTTSSLRRFPLQRIASFFAKYFTFIAFNPTRFLALNLAALHPFTSWEDRIFIYREISCVSNKVAAYTLRGLRKFDSEKHLSQIKIPTLIILGDLDFFTDLRHALVLLYKINFSTLKIIKNAGHMSIIEQPLQVNLVLKNFLHKYHL